MLYAFLICSDEKCAEESEAWGLPEDFERMACDCGCTLQAIAFCEMQPVAFHRSRPRLELQQVG